MNYLLLTIAVLLQLSQAVYNPKLSLQMGYMSAVTMNPISQISSWTCPECKKYPVTDVQRLITMQVKAFLNTTLDIQGFVGYSAVHNVVIAAFRGSVDIKNWIANIDFKQISYSKCSGCLIHEGFFTAYSEVSAIVKAQVQVILNKYRTAGVYVTGHSLGGALATIAALDIKATFGKLNQFYSFGEPRVGNAAFANYFNSQMQVHRVIHYADLVPHVPPSSVNNYTHGGAQFWYTEDMQTYKTCTAQDPTCANSLPPNALNTNDHSLSAYLKMPTSLIQMLGLLSDN